MKKIFVFAIAMVMVLGFAGLAFAGVSGSAHDLQSGKNMAEVPYSTLNAGAGLGVGTVQICVFCHHPHRGATASTITKNTLLWNMDDFSASSYDTYSQSGSMNATGVGDPVTAADTNAAQSFLCMACHDGVIGANSLVTSPGEVPTANIATAYNLVPGAALGTTLADDHPVNIDYPSEDNDILANAGNWVNGLVYPLFGGKMQCGTCHDVHAGGVDSASASSNMDFMRGDIIGSQMCLDCHLNK